MHRYSVDYKKQGRADPGTLINRGFWVHLPRPLLTCRLLGHKPVIDGTEGFRGQPGYRWVCCDRCGVRPEPQGSPDPSTTIGDPVTADEMPGPWPENPEGVVGGQVIVGKSHKCGFSMKVGNCGSEHTLAADIGLPFAGALYLHTEQFGTWLQRRLNPVGYESKVISADVNDGRLYWRIWASRDGSRGRDSWRDGSVRVDPRDIILGPQRYSYTDVSGPSTVHLTMPDGDQHEVEMTLKRQSFGRPKGRQKLSYTVQCDSRDGIPYRHGHRSGINGWGVDVSDAAVENGLWQLEAAAATVAKVVRMRVQNRWKPSLKVS